MKTTWDVRFSQRVSRMKSSRIRDLLKIVGNKDIISFSGGFPAPSVFPIDAFQKAAKTALKERGIQALQYGATDGYQPLREWIAENNPVNLKVSPEHVIITSGSQQALDLLGKIFINPGDHVLVESPTYLGALQAWGTYGAEYISVPIDENGLIPEKMEEALRYNPKFIYLQPNFHNPAGVSISPERRRKIIEIADQYGTPIVEDDPYGMLAFDTDPGDSFIRIDSIKRNCQDDYCGDVVYLSTFSKILAPGLRLAYAIGPRNVIQKFNLAKQATDLQTSTFSQVIAHEVLSNPAGFLAGHVEMIKNVYRERRSTMLEALEQYAPEGISWTHPKGGLFLWAYFPETVDTCDLLNYALEEGVAFVPGVDFFPDADKRNNTMRLNFSNAEPAKIVEGVQKLFKAYQRYMKDHL